MSARFVIRRVLLGTVTLFVVSLIVFGATLALPGDAATAILGQGATPARVEALRQQLHLDQSAVQQYLSWLGGIVTADPGSSIVAQEPVTTLLSSRVVNTAFLMLVAGLIGIPLAIALGVFLAMRRDRPVDDVLSTGTLVVAALPEFVVAIALILLFATQVAPVLPAVSLIPDGTSPWAVPQNIVLPAATLIIVIVPYISRIMRGSMIEVLESDYVMGARLSGLPERKVVWLHAVPNGLAPAVQASALALAWMAGGIVVVEFVFGYPGIGAALVDAVRNRDLPVVQAVTMLIAAFYVVVNLLADLVAIALTPKLRAQSA